MTDDGDAKLLRMAHEISQFFRHQGDAAPAAAAHHLRQFWPPVMRKRFLEIVESDGARDETLRRIAAALAELR